MFGDASGDAFTPHAEAAGFKGAAHVLNDLRFGEASTLFNFVEAGAIMPCKTDDGVGSFGREFSFSIRLGGHFKALVVVFCYVVGVAGGRRRSNR